MRKSQKGTNRQQSPKAPRKSANQSVQITPGPKGAPVARLSKLRLERSLRIKAKAGTKPRTKPEGLPT